MRHIKNTLYITQEDSFVHKVGEAIVVHHEKQKIGQFPIIAISDIVCFGFGINVSAPLAEFCTAEGVSITYLNGNGRFQARMQGPIRGNVLLRRQQYRDADSAHRALEIARCCVAAKTANQRASLQRFIRNHGATDDDTPIDEAITRLTIVRKLIPNAADVDALRGIEGEAAAVYFSVFDRMILTQSPLFAFSTRNRRPPMDRVNAMLSFAYSLLALDMRSAAESVGLDPYVGFLHAERPGRPSLALDMVEEFRAPFADRLVLSLINLQQVDPDGFKTGPSGEVEMNNDTRKAFLAAYQKRKRETVRHPFLEEEMELGVAFLEQARLLARHIRGDLELYPAYMWK
jgi:CRISPR-associated protein Cas1